mmetsp:Transcript_52307/g.124809  ORF Transcript_52307/g.124809 Transcript_52307/m.124809 type:complete len:1096 (+) Transcript_52307:135-3422(+)
MSALASFNADSDMRGIAHYSPGISANTDGNWRPRETTWQAVPTSQLPRSGASAPSSLSIGDAMEAATFGVEVPLPLPASCSKPSTAEYPRTSSSERRAKLNGTGGTCASTQVPSQVGRLPTRQSDTRTSEWASLPSSTREDFFSSLQRQSADMEPAPGKDLTSLPSALRAETPILAYVDRVSMPGYVDYEDREAKLQQLDREMEWQQASYWSGRPAEKPAVTKERDERGLQDHGFQPLLSVQPLDEWEAELAAWKRQYGCPVAGQEEEAGGATVGAAEDSTFQGGVLPDLPVTFADDAAVARELPRGPLAEELPTLAPEEESAAPAIGHLAPESPPLTVLAFRRPREAPATQPQSDCGAREQSLGAELTDHQQLEPPPPQEQETAPAMLATDSMVNVCITQSDLFRPSFMRVPENSEADVGVTASSPLAPRPETPAQEVPINASESVESPSMVADQLLEDTATATPVPSAPAASPPVIEAAIDGPIGACPWEDDSSNPFSPPDEQAATLVDDSLADSPPSKPVQHLEPGQLKGMCRDITVGMLHPPDSQPAAPQEAVEELEEASAVEPLAALVPRPPAVEGKPASPPSRRYVYTKEDMEQATGGAKQRLGADGAWKSEYTAEGGLHKRDFLVDLRRHRERDKGRQATGPVWLHLAQQAKNLADTLDLSELLEVLKLFCSVRYSDYELYMRLLGEVPRYIAEANAAQLCELVRLLARRRLRERTYVDMVGAHLLQKIRVTDDVMHARLLVKTANAFAALDVRSHPKFVEHFLRHIEHRIEELDASLCCQVSPIFVSSYMTDAVRRAYLKRCAELQAGFHGDLDECRNLAQTEFIMRKEHHSVLTSLPAYVGRYLEKMRKHASFEKWGTVSLPPPVAPNGPKGNHKSDISYALQMKATTQPVTGSNRADVFSSEMHRDVSACLTHLGIEHENGVLCGPYLLDIVALDMVNPSKRLVYEVNAEHHYYEGTEQLTAEKRLRHRMIGRLGQKLHMVHASEWRPLSAAQKMNYLLKLQQAQQEENSRELQQQAAANTMRSPLPAISYVTTSKPEPFKLKSVRDLSAPIRVPVPPSLKNSPDRTSPSSERRRAAAQAPLSAR